MFRVGQTLGQLKAVILDRSSANRFGWVICCRTQPGADHFPNDPHPSHRWPVAGADRRTIRQRPEPSGFLQAQADCAELVCQLEAQVVGSFQWTEVNHTRSLDLDRSWLSRCRALWLGYRAGSRRRRSPPVNAWL